MTDGDSPSSRHGPAGTRELARRLPAVVLVILLIAFVADNTRRVTVGYVVGDTRVPLIFVLVATALVGAVLAWLLTWRRKH
jgi:uncharacterized integral membrane protein